MSSSEEIDSIEQTELAGSNEITFISHQIALYPEVLSKSQIPSMKCKKDTAIREMLRKYEITFGKRIDATKLLKKINNMKTRLKKKTDLNKTGNKRIHLLDWEKVMLEALHSDTNPVLNRVPGNLDIIY